MTTSRNNKTTFSKKFNKILTTGIVLSVLFAGNTFTLNNQAGQEETQEDVNTTTSNVNSHIDAELADYEVLSVDDAKKIDNNNTNGDNAGEAKNQNIFNSFIPQLPEAKATGTGTSTGKGGISGGGSSSGSGSLSNPEWIGYSSHAGKSALQQLTDAGVKFVDGTSVTSSSITEKYGDKLGEACADSTYILTMQWTHSGSKKLVGTNSNRDTNISLRLKTESVARTFLRNNNNFGISGQNMIVTEYQAFIEAFIKWDKANHKIINAGRVSRGTVPDYDIICSGYFNDGKNIVVNARFTNVIPSYFVTHIAPEAGVDYPGNRLGLFTQQGYSSLATAKSQDFKYWSEKKPAADRANGNAIKTLVPGVHKRTAEGTGIRDNNNGLAMLMQYYGTNRSVPAAGTTTNVPPAKSHYNNFMSTPEIHNWTPNQVYSQLNEANKKGLNAGGIINVERTKTDQKIDFRYDLTYECSENKSSNFSIPKLFYYTNSSKTGNPIGSADFIGRDATAYTNLANIQGFNVDLTNKTYEQRYSNNKINPNLINFENIKNNYKIMYCKDRNPISTSVTTSTASIVQEQIDTSTKSSFQILGVSCNNDELLNMFGNSTLVDFNVNKNGGSNLDKVTALNSKISKSNAELLSGRHALIVSRMKVNLKGTSSSNIDRRRDFGYEWATPTSTSTGNRGLMRLTERGFYYKPCVSEIDVRDADTYTFKGFSSFILTVSPEVGGGGNNTPLIEYASNNTAVDQIGENNLNAQTVAVQTEFGKIVADIESGATKITTSNFSTIRKRLEDAIKADKQNVANGIELNQKNKEGLAEGGVLTITDTKVPLEIEIIPPANVMTQNCYTYNRTTIDRPRYTPSQHRPGLVNSMFPHNKAETPNNSGNPSGDGTLMHSNANRTSPIIKDGLASFLWASWGTYAASGNTFDRPKTFVEKYRSRVADNNGKYKTTELYYGEKSAGSYYAFPFTRINTSGAIMGTSLNWGESKKLLSSTLGSDYVYSSLCDVPKKSTTTFKINVTDNIPETSNEYQILSVNCNQEGFNSLFERTLPAEQAGQTLTQGNAVSDGLVFAGIAQTSVYENNSNKRMLARSGSVEADLGFYDKECAFACTPSSAASNGATSGSTGNKAADNVGQPAGWGASGPKYGVISGDDDYNSNSITAFRDNIETNLKIDVWYPSTTELIDYKNLSQEDKTAKSTIVNLWEHGTPTAIGNNALTSYSATINGEKEEFTFEGSNVQPVQTNWSPRLESIVTTKTSAFLPGQVNELQVKSAWASEDRKPQVINIKWEYDANLTKPVTTNVGFTYNSNGTATAQAANYQNVTSLVDGKCSAYFGTSSATPTPEEVTKVEQNTGTGSTNNIDGNIIGLTSSTLPEGYNKDLVANNSIIINYIRSAEE